jgi:hypothetical protein
VSEYTSTFLFANPSLLYGVASLLDFEGTFTTYNYSRNRPEADARALYYDWRTVGEALNEAMSKFSTETQVEQAL